jgi:hypothetical protein
MNKLEIQALEDKHLIMMGAKDMHTGKKIYDTDLKHRRDCFALATQIAEAKMAATPEPVQINGANLAYMNRVQAAINPATGARFFDDVNSGLRTAHMKALAHIDAGTIVPPDVVAILHATGVK